MEETEAPQSTIHTHRTAWLKRDVLSEDDTDLTAPTDVWETPLAAEVSEAVSGQKLTAVIPAMRLKIIH